MSWIYRIGAFIIFVLSLTRETEDANYLVIGWLIFILAEICDLKEEIKSDRITKLNCDRNRGSD